jgi:hypothetical protein
MEKRTGSIFGNFSTANVNMTADSVCVAACRQVR